MFAIRKLHVARSKVLFGLTLLLTIASVRSFAADWRLIGPEGGNVRSLAYDPGNPNHMLLGTSAGQIFASQDGGNSWELFAHLGLGEDFVIDHIVFDPSNPAIIFAAGWGLFHDDEGDVFRSDDAGHTWRALEGTHGKSIRAMAMALSDNNTLVIGALDGVFRSRDGGATWTRMTPENPTVMENHASMKNFVSVAVDPQNPDTVYAGTRHLAWKTTDGGSNWHNTKEGMLDDSDVFSIIVDPKTPSRVYASACSGIYKSDNGAELFHRVQGLPHSAIRTRVLKQDPQRPSIVYAGTTGGLWKTIDGGTKWTLVTSPDVIVNDVLIDPRNPERVMLATDLGGVLATNDGFAHYAPSNRGFSHRVVGGVVVDRKDPNRIYVGVANDRDKGGMFVSDDAGKNWRQSSRGLAERDILSLEQSADGTLFAGTNHGIYFLPSLSGSWQSASMIFAPLPQLEAKGTDSSKTIARTKSSRTASNSTAKAKVPTTAIIPAATSPRVRSIQIGDNTWYAATNEGLFTSVDHGLKWYGQPVAGERNFTSVDSYENGTLSLVSLKAAYLSQDRGETWTTIAIPTFVTAVNSLNMMPDSTLWLGTREGALRSIDSGKTWKYMLGGLPKNDVLAVNFDASGRRLLATAMHEHGVFQSKDNGQSWQKTPNALVSIRWAIPYQGRLLAVSPYNGLLMEQSIDSITADSSRTSASLLPED